MEQRYLYRHNPIVKKIFLSMLAPTILMNLTTAIGSMADTVIIGHYLDDLSLSVVTFATPIYMVINTFAALFAVGGCIAMSIDSGKGEKENANRAYSVSMLMLALTGAVLLLTGVFFSAPITHWLGAGEDIFASVETYSKIILVGAPVFVLNIGLAFFVRNDGRPTLSMVGMFASIVVDIILNVVFVGMMDMGVSGAAYSTVLGQLVSIIIIASHFLSSRNTLKFRFTFDSTAFRIIKNGGSSALHFVYQFVTILIINHFLSKLAGTNGVVIYTVVFNLSTVSLSVFEGISQTLQPMISNYFGEKSYKNIKETLRLAFVTVVIICGSVTLLLEIFPETVPVVFGIEDGSLIQQSAAAVRIYAVSMIITTVNVVIGYYLQSIEQTFTATVMISLRNLVLFLGATVILGKIFGMNGVWAAYTVAEVLAFAICLLMLRIKQKKSSKSGTKTNILLLEEETEKSINCFTFSFTQDETDTYIKTVSEKLNFSPEIKEAVSLDAIAYLKALSKCSASKKRRYIETEINSVAKKVIIRDNLDHSAIKNEIKTLLSDTSNADYSPVLGWNRICLE